MHIRRILKICVCTQRICDNYIGVTRFRDILCDLLKSCGHCCSIGTIQLRCPNCRCQIGTFIGAVGICCVHHIFDSRQHIRRRLPLIHRIVVAGFIILRSISLGVPPTVIIKSRIAISQKNYIGVGITPVSSPCRQYLFSLPDSSLPISSTILVDGRRICFKRIQCCPRATNSRIIVLSISLLAGESNDCQLDIVFCLCFFKRANQPGNRVIHVLPSRLVHTAGFIHNQQNINGISCPDSPFHIQRQGIIILIILQDGFLMFRGTQRRLHIDPLDVGDIPGSFAFAQCRIAILRRPFSDMNP